MPPARTRSSTSCASAHSPATATSGIAASRRTSRLRAIASSSATSTRSGSTASPRHVGDPRRVRRHRQRHLRPCGVAHRGDRQHRLTIIGERQPALDDFDAAAARPPAAIRARIFDRDDQPFVGGASARSSTISPAWPAAGPCLTAFSASGSSNIGGMRDVGQRLGQPARDAHAVGIAQPVQLEQRVEQRQLVRERPGRGAHARQHGAQHRRQPHDRALGGLAVLAAPLGDRVQRVEQEVRIEVRAQREQLRAFGLAREQGRPRLGARQPVLQPHVAPQAEAADEEQRQADDDAGRRRQQRAAHPEDARAPRCRATRPRRPRSWRTGSAGCRRGGSRRGRGTAPATTPARR